MKSIILTIAGTPFPDILGFQCQRMATFDITKTSASRNFCAQLHRACLFRGQVHIR